MLGTTIAACLLQGPYYLRPESFLPGVLLVGGLSLFLPAYDHQVHNKPSTFFQNLLGVNWSANSLHCGVNAGAYCALDVLLLVPYLRRDRIAHSRSPSQHVRTLQLLVNCFYFYMESEL